MMTKMAQTQIASHRSQAAGIRMRATQERLRAKIEAVAEELDDVTSPHGVPTTDLGEEDSAVIVVAEVIRSAQQNRRG